MTQLSIHMKRQFKDSVFTDLFSIPEYLLQLYQELHPEDSDALLSDLRTVTLQNVLTDVPYNDLGFTVRDRLVVLVEAQSTWTPNIIIRALIYMVHTLEDWIKEHDVNLYSGSARPIPAPELYVVYTGTRNVPTELTLSRDFFGGKEYSIDVRVKVLRGGGTGIVSQYVEFARIGNESVGRYAHTREAVQRTIDECIAKGILVDYLIIRRREVEDIMYKLYDEEEVLRVYIRDCIRQHDAERDAAKAREMAARMLKAGLSDAMVADIVDLPLEEVQAIATECPA